MTVVGAPAPFRIAFDNARDPYTARNALGIDASAYALLASPTFTGTVTVDEIALAGILSTTPPGSPVDGQLWALQPTGSAGGTTWMFRYNAGSASTYKWEFIGGMPLVNSPSGSMSTTSVSSVDLTGGPSFAMDRAGDYWVEVGILAQSFVAGAYEMAGYAHCSNPVGDSTPAKFITVSQFNGGAVISALLFSAVVAGATFNIRCNVSAANNSSFSNGYLKITPIRVI